MTDDETTDKQRARDRIAWLEHAINNPLGWKAEYADNLARIAKLERELAETRANLVALQSDFNATINAPCPHCGGKP
jgi:hypothetical protein